MSSENEMCFGQARIWFLMCVVMSVTAVDVEAEAKDLGQFVFGGIVKGQNTPVIALMVLPSHELLSSGRTI
jgi:hypothetical protein